MDCDRRERCLLKSRLSDIVGCPFGSGVVKLVVKNVDTRRFYSGVVKVFRGCPGRILCDLVGVTKARSATQVGAILNKRGISSGLNRQRG